MKITKSQLKQIIKEELNEGGYAGYAEPGDEELYRELIQKIGSSEDFDRLLYVINRLGVEEGQVILDLGAAAHGPNSIAIDSAPPLADDSDEYAPELEM